MKKPFLILYLFIPLLFSCNNQGKRSPEQYRKDSIQVAHYINQGDSIYKIKNSYNNFAKSLELYDSAWQVASGANDTLLLARAVFAKGRAYDAINNNPQMTIDFYSEAARLYATIPREQKKALYIKHLVAHSYDKVMDSAHCIQILSELYNEILTKPDSIKKELSFTVEMAVISTTVKNYTLADSILKFLTRREWIKNDSTEYDYLNHYIIVKARTDVRYNHNFQSPYLDSLETIFAKSPNLNDSVYYSNELWELNRVTGNKAKEAYYLHLNNKVYNKFNTPETVREVRDKLAKMEIATVEAKRLAELEKAEIRKRFIYILAGLVVVISLLAIFLVRRNKEIRRKRNEVVDINQQLYQKNLQNELLNKEIHHRVKNNLQMIMSLVYMQEKNTDTEEVKENMQNIRLRIESIAKLHQQLMEQTDVVDLRKYIQYLVSNASNLMADSRKVITHLNVESIRVPQKISFPLGLIINEWVTNSIKYAVPADGSLEISVSIINNNGIQVRYRDNGRKQSEANGNKSLGLEIVHILIEQLEGKLETGPDNKYAYNLTIPLIHG
ncbi:MAG: sensor histidine kinase [Bacteroidetes bacterium]|nr:sensor histidine kinase [Bacteroidota bacterium]